MKYFIPMGTTALVSAPHSSTLRKSFPSVYTEFSLILSELPNSSISNIPLKAGILNDGWLWILRSDGGICFYHTDTLMFLDIAKKDIQIINDT